MFLASDGYEAPPEDAPQQEPGASRSEKRRGAEESGTSSAVLHAGNPDPDPHPNNKPSHDSLTLTPNPDLDPNDDP